MQSFRSTPSAGAIHRHAGHAARAPRTALTALSALTAGIALAAIVTSSSAQAQAQAQAQGQAPAPVPHAGAGHHTVIPAGSIKWPDPPSGRPGTQITVLTGDLAKEVPFTIRIKMPDGYRVAPHWHPGEEHLTVVQGTFLIGTGEKFDAAAMKPMATGDYAHMPKEMRHFGAAKGETIVQVHGIGPFVVNWVNPEDDPRRKPTGSK